MEEGVSWSMADNHEAEAELLLLLILLLLFICHPTIAGDSTNILLNFTLHDAKCY